jgi:hypothetical protein
MSRSRFLPLPTQGGAARLAGSAGLRAALAPPLPPVLAAGLDQPVTRPARAARSRDVSWLGFACPLAPGQAWPAVHAALERVLSAGAPVETVILDLTGATGIEDGDCASLVWLHERLRPAGARLWLAAIPRPLADRLRDCGVTGLLGAGAIHPSRRAAVLAAFAALPGPGLVTPQLRAALAVPPEPLPAAAPEVPAAEVPAPEVAAPQVPAPPAPARVLIPAAARPAPAPAGLNGRLHPLRVEPPPRRGWWTVVARFNTRRGRRHG